MKHSHQVPETLIARAAAMRAAGDTWEEIAAAVDRSAERIRHWPSTYPEVWCRHYRRAETQYLADAAMESRKVVRMLLRSKNEKIQLSAAQGMIRARVSERALELRIEAAKAAAANADGPSAEDIALYHSIRDMTIEEVDQRLKEIAAEYLASSSNGDTAGAANGGNASEPGQNPATEPPPDAIDGQDTTGPPPA